MIISKNSVVTMNYILNNVNGELLETSNGFEPMEYLHGHNNIIPKLEEALDGKKPGDNIKIVIQPEDAYGLYHEHLHKEVPLDAFEGIENIEPGFRFIANTEIGQIPVTVEEVLENSVIVEGNHPLAGVELHFDVTIDTVRAATEEEISHGHIHGGNECCGGHGNDECCGGHGNDECCGGKNDECCGGHSHEDDGCCGSDKPHGSCGCS